MWTYKYATSNYISSLVTLGKLQKKQLNGPWTQPTVIFKEARRDKYPVTEIKWEQEILRKKT